MAKQRKSAKRAGNTEASHGKSGSVTPPTKAQAGQTSRRPSATQAKRATQPERMTPKATSASPKAAETTAPANVSQPTSLAREALAARGRYHRSVWTVAGVIAAVLVAGLLIHGLLTPAASAANTANIHATPAPPDPLVGHYAPDVTLTDLSGNHVKLSSLRGKIIILNFWYVACDPCRYEMPALEKAYLKYRSQGVVIVGLDVVDKASDAANFVHQLGVTYPIMLDNSLTAAQVYNVQATPTSFFIDRGFVIRYKSLGPLDTSTLNSELAALLKQQ